MKKMNLYLAIITILAISPLFAAEIVGVNFIGSDTPNGTLNSGDYAGLAGGEVANTLGNTFAANWNNAAGNTGSASTLVNNSGATVSGLSVSWNCFNVHAIPDVTSGDNNGGTGGANPTMMKGYLDNGDEGTVTVSVSGIAYEEYSVVVYMDGNNEEFWRRGNIQLNDGTLYSTILEDSQNVDFNSGSGNNANGLFQGPVPGLPGDQNWPFTPNNSEGNFVIFTGLTGSSFTLTNSNDTFEGDFGRAPINAIQIVAVPEPATMGLLALGGAAMLRRRRK